MVETRQHAELKRLAATAAERRGWRARLEAPVVTPSGRRWVADVLLEKGARRVAVEAQWSSQPVDQYLERQRRYAEAGVEVVWLHRAERLEPSPAVVEGHVSEAPGGGYTVRLKGCPGQRLPAEAFVAAALEGALRFGLREDDPVTLTVMAAEIECWHEGCGARYPMIPTLLASLGDPRFLDPGAAQLNVGLLEAGDCPETRPALLATLAALGGWEHVRDQHSRTMGRGYLSCGCPRCGRIVGDHFAFQHIGDAKPVGAFEAPLSLLARTAAIEAVEDHRAWIVW